VKSAATAASSLSPSPSFIHRVTMMSLKSTHCPYFSPNIFNDTKCQNCFRTKEIHLSGALEKQRVSQSCLQHPDHMQNNHHDTGSA
jgi:C4-type Zn-finger protein